MSVKAKYALDATIRVDQGKGASRRLRRLQDQVPGILYGGGEAPQPIALDHKKVRHALENPGFYTHLLTLNLEGNKQQVILKALQRHPAKKAILHMDFLRVKPTDSIVMRIPLHFVGVANCLAVKNEGAIVNHQMNDLEIRCQVKDLPEFIEVDISQMTLDQTLHLSDLKLPKGAESVALSHGPEHDHPVVSVHLPRAIVEEEAAPAEEAPTEESSASQKTESAASTDAGDKAKIADKGKGKGK